MLLTMPLCRWKVSQLPLRPLLLKNNNDDRINQITNQPG